MNKVEEIVIKCTDIMYNDPTLFPVVGWLDSVYPDFGADDHRVNPVKYHLQTYIGLNYIVSSEFRQIEVIYQYIDPKLKQLLINNIIVMVLDQFVTKEIGFNLNKKNNYIACLRRNNLIDEENPT